MSTRQNAIRASILAGFVLSGLFLWLALRQVDARELGRTFAAIALGPVLLSACAVAASMALRAVRWRLIAGLPPSHHRQFARATYLGLLVNQLFPGRLGELVRVVTLAKLSGSTFVAPLASAVLDRLIDIVVLIGYAMALYLMLPLDEVLTSWIGYLLSASAVVAVGLALFVKGAHLWEKSVSALTERWLQHWSLRPDVLLSELRHEFHAILSDWNRFGSVAALGLLILFCDYMIIASLFLSVDIPLSPLAPLLVLFCMAAGSALPSAPGYLGIYQAAAMVAFAFFSQPPEKAVALATIVQLLNLAIAFLLNGRGAITLIRRVRANPQKIE